MVRVSKTLLMGITIKEIMRMENLQGSESTTGRLGAISKDNSERDCAAGWASGDGDQARATSMKASIAMTRRKDSGCFRGRMGMSTAGTM